MAKSKNKGNPSPNNILLSYTNYFEWEITTERELALAGALAHAIDAEIEEPAIDDYEAWKFYQKGRKAALKIIVMSLDLSMYLKYREVIINGNPYEIWKAITEEEGKLAEGGFTFPNVSAS
ncbi:hypothetical protein VTL71DRAFT_14070 [Oculimacula yallundae]|uniref:Uncharacterized protein n=1 Tax=Oculimacula yallundae TaxID=86028 RepID=A0ABR4CJH8_9HELO